MNTTPAGTAPLAATGSAIEGRTGQSARSGGFGAMLSALESRAASRQTIPTDDPVALLKAQAALYREVERLELTSRLVDQGVGAVKTILQTRV